MNNKCKPQNENAKPGSFNACNVQVSLSDSGGMALIITLVILTLLTALVVEFAYGVYINTNALNNWQESQRLSLTARSALRLASGVISGNIDNYSYTHPDLLKDYNGRALALSRDIATVYIEDESAKFNLNSLVYPNGMLNKSAYDSFVRLLTDLRLDPDIAPRVADWIDPDAEEKTAGSELKAKNGYLDSVDELLLVRGIDRASYDRVAPYVTIYGNGLVNVNCADVPVLMSLSESIDKETAERIVSYRENTPFERPENILKVAGLETAGASLMGRITVKGTVFHITSVAQAGPIKRVIESVLEISGRAGIVKYWREI